MPAPRPEKGKTLKEISNSKNSSVKKKRGRKPGDKPDVVPYSKGIKELFIYIYQNTGITQAKLSELSGVSRKTIERWWKSIEEIPEHRLMSARGGRCMSPIKVMQARIDELEQDLKEAEASVSLVEKVNDPGAILSTIVSNMKGKILSARLGEMAQAAKAILAVEESNRKRHVALPDAEPKWATEIKQALKSISKPVLTDFDKGETPDVEGANYE